MREFTPDSKTEIIKTAKIAAILNKMLVAELKKLIDRLAIPAKKSQRKRELVMEISDFIRSCPDEVASCMSEPDLILMRRLLAGEKILCKPQVAVCAFLSVQVGLVVLKRSTEYPALSELILLDESAELLREPVKRQQDSILRQAYQYLTGWSNLCGVVDIMEAVEELKNSGDDFSGLELHDILTAIHAYGDEGQVYFEHAFNDGMGSLAFISPLTPLIGRMNLLCDEKDLAGKKRLVAAYTPKKFTFHEVMNAAFTLLDVDTPNQDERAHLLEICNKFGMDDIASRNLLMDLWIYKQKDPENFNIADFLDRFRFSSINEVNEATFALTGYLNSLPFWTFLGSSSKEAAASAPPLKPGERPRLMPGPNLRAQGKDIPQEVRDAWDRMWDEHFESHPQGDGYPGGFSENLMGDFLQNIQDPIVNSEPKIGRNDPCPCGSGKKYKKCCGR